MNQESLFAEVYKAHAPAVLKMCMAYTDDHDLAQDFLQESFIKVWQNIGSFRGDSKISTWIYRIAVNTCLSHIRSLKNKSPDALNEYFDRADENNSAEKEQQVQQLYSAMQKLPEAERLIISMVLEEIPYDEIAGAVGISEGNLRVKIHRIKAQLTNLFFSNENI